MKVNVEDVTVLVYVVTVFPPFSIKFGLNRGESIAFQLSTIFVPFVDKADGGTYICETFTAAPVVLSWNRLS